MHNYLSPADLNDYMTKTKGSAIGIGAGNGSVTNIVTMVKPRYHFVAGKNLFYQRVPYRNERAQGPGPFTRLISVSEVADIAGMDAQQQKMKK